MKKILLEYANVFAYAIIGLVFGLAFFLLFLNFYHAKELAIEVDVTSDMQKHQQDIDTKIGKVKTNISGYNQYTYKGSNNIYDMNSIQIRLNNCLTILEGEDAKKLTSKSNIMLKDVYELNNFYQNQILNDCVVMQLNVFGTSDNSFAISSLYQIKPFVGLNIDNLLSSSSYITANLQNADSYYFSNDINRESIFSLVKDSYHATMSNYQDALDLIVEISNWYRKEIG